MATNNPRRRPINGGSPFRSPKVTGVSTSRRKLGFDLNTSLTVPDLIFGTIPSPIDGYVGSSFSFDPSAYVTGAVGAQTWTLIGGTLPDGLSLNPSTGEIFGVPTTIETQLNLQLEIQDAGFRTDQSNLFSIDIL